MKSLVRVLNNLSKYTFQRLDDIEMRLERMDGRLKVAEKALNIVQENVSGVKDDVSDVKQTVESVGMRPKTQINSPNKSLTLYVARYTQIRV